MICLSKADKSTFKRLSWNQSPPALSPGQTTRQDLNGISNLREHVDAGQDDSIGDGGGGGGRGSSAASLAGQRACFDGQVPLLPLVAVDAGRWDDGVANSPSSCPKAADGGDDHNRPPRVPSPRRYARVWSWVTWLISVLFCSYVLSAISVRGGWISLRRQSLSYPHVSVQTAQAQQADASTWRNERNINLKRSTCKAGGVSSEDYNTALHGAAIFIIWFVSTLGCVFPLLATKFPGLRIPRRFFFAVRHFGTGVLIATAFVHLLPTAFVSLGDPCLGKFWNKDYQAMPGAIALAAIFLVTVIEMVFHPGRHVSPNPVRNECCPDEAVVENGVEELRHQAGGGAIVPDKGPLRGRSSSMAQGLSKLQQTRPENTLVPLQQGSNDDESKSAIVEAADYSFDEPRLTPEQKQRKDRLQCILLEMGILFHSVFIGMALSVSIGTDFVVLLIAIVFHQTFEGLALGSRISAVHWTGKTKQPWMMALAYGFTTPLGQIIGLATHSLYSPDSEVGLILVGVMNAISAGLLTFASLVELLSEDFLSDESWRILRGKRRVIACLLVFFGAFFMSLVGAWA